MDGLAGATTSAKIIEREVAGAEGTATERRRPGVVGKIGEDGRLRADRAIVVPEAR